MSAKLLDSFQRIKTIIEAIPHALFILDEAGNIVFYNRAVLALAKYSESQLIDRPLADLLELKGGKNFLDCLRQERLNDLQGAYFSKNHRRVPITISAIKVTQKNAKKHGYLVVIEDLRQFKAYAKTRLDQITPYLQQISLGDFSRRLDFPSANDEFGDLMTAIDLMAVNLRELMQENHEKALQLEQANQKLKEVNQQLELSKMQVEDEKAADEAILLHLSDSMIATDHEGKIMFLNGAATNLFGLDQVKDLGKKLKRLVPLYDEHGGKIKDEQLPIVRVLRTERRVKGIYCLDSRAHFVVEVIAAPIKRNQKLTGVIVTHRNITKEKQIDRAKSEFVSLASHQLRTPLTGIKWLLQEIRRKGGLTKVQTEYLNDALYSNERMILLVNDLLNISRLEANTIDVQSHPVVLDKLIRSLLKSPRLLAKEKRQKIVYRASNKELSVTLDPNLITHVIENLVANAIHYSPERSQIEVGYFADKKGVEIYVKDQGIGISKQDQEKLFTKFFRSNQAVKSNTKGSGLGLYMVKKVLEACKGSIDFKSFLGRGTTFTVHLPMTGPVSSTSHKKLVRKKLI